MKIPGTMYLIYREISYQKHESYLSIYTGLIHAEISVGFMITFRAFSDLLGKFLVPMKLGKKNCDFGKKYDNFGKK